MSQSNANPGRTRSRRLWPAFTTMIACVFVAAILYLALSRGTPGPPAVPTDGLDPAVAKLIGETMREVRLAPRAGAVWGKLGSVLMHYEFAEEARFAFVQAEGFSPAEPRWPYLKALLLLTHDGSAAVPHLQRALELCRDNPDMPRLRLAQLLAERGRSEEAEPHFQTLLQLTPDHPPALLGLARLRQVQGRWADSTNLLNACLDGPHTAKSAHALLATVQQALGNPAAAEAAARRSASLPTDTPWPDPFWQEAGVYRVGQKAMIEDASALLDRGRFAEALQVLGNTTREYPDDEEAWYLMGWAWNQAGSAEGVLQDSALRASRSAFAAAEHALREHLRRSPQSPKGHAQLAVALLGRERYAEAIEVLDAAVKLKPTWRELHSNLGYACVQLNRHDEAIRHFRSALNCDPSYPASYTALADLLSRRGDIAEARQLLRQAFELNPSDPRARALLERIEPGR